VTWTLRRLLEAAGIESEPADDVDVLGLSYDSRAVSRGDLFCCMPGAVHDGHDFAATAAADGAAALLVERPVPVDLPQARVRRVRNALGPLADAFFGHPSRDMKVAAVTGTNGKTTVTYLLESIVRAAGLRPGVVGTVSRRYGDIAEPAARSTPEAVDVQRLLRRMADAGVDVVALEATSDGLAQQRLAATSFATAAFTNLTQDHLNTHGSMEAYFEAKASLFEPSYTPRAVVNVADRYGRMIVERSRGRIDVLTYGTDDADVRARAVDVSVNGSRARVATPSAEIEIETPLRGRYNVDNCLCAIGVSVHLGLPPDAIVAGIAAVGTVPGRLEPIDSARGFTVLVDYAHTPDALENALRAARELAPRRVIVVFGCGGDRDRTKRPLMGRAATSIADVTIVTSDNPRSEDPLAIIREIETGAVGDYSVVADRRAAIEAALAQAASGDVVVVAGKGHEHGQTIGGITLPFDDREVVRELLGESLCPS
jgi:UDP-N-acetylmuramoyl-L-alanyl-D-glutamate--2,6-diaminopimelate ligase